MKKFNVLVVVQKLDKDAMITIVSKGVVSPLILIRDIGNIDCSPYLLYGSHVNEWVSNFTEPKSVDICIQVARMTSSEMEDYSSFWRKD